MVRTKLLLLMLVWGCLVGSLPGQPPAESPPGEPGPVVVTTLPHPSFSSEPAGPGLLPPPPPNVLPLPPLPPPPPPCPIGPPPCIAGEDCNGRLLRGDPWLDRPCGQKPGWFANLELGILKPDLDDRLVALVDVGGLFTDIVLVPAADLAWTVSPQVELGYRFGQGAGELLVVYRNLASDGCGRIDDFDFFGAAVLKTRLDLNVVDLDYGSQEFALGPQWDMRWRVGVRIASVWFDSRAQDLLFGQRSSNSVLGAGPQGSLELARYLGTSRFALVGKVEGSSLLTRITQSFEETVSMGGFPVLGGAVDQRDSQSVPTLRVQAGLSWTPVFSSHALRLFAGYEYEHWWWLGHIFDSRAELRIQGLFFRGEWTF